MLVVEQLSSSHAHHQHTHRLGHHAGAASRDSVFDVELAGLESEEEDIPRPRRASAPRTNTETDSPLPAYPITIGLVVHGLADGLALGMSVLSNDDPSSSYSLSLVVFLALAVHKGMHSRHIYFFPVAHVFASVQLLRPLLILCLSCQPLSRGSSAENICCYSVRPHQSEPLLLMRPFPSLERRKWMV